MEYVTKEINGLPASLLYNCGLNAGAFLRGGSKNVILGSFKEEDIVGCILYNFVKKKETFFDDYPENGAYVEFLCTDKDYRKKGIGKSLFEACVRDARIKDVSNKLVYGDPLNLEAVVFYKKAGIGLREDTEHRNRLKQRDTETEEWRKKAISDIKSGKKRYLEVRDRSGKIVGKTPISLHYLESFDFSSGGNGGLEKILSKINDFNLIWHDISEVEPSYFLKEGDLQERKEHWSNRLKK